ncbi:GTP 3',8-cyclase [Austwickia sp. TVS 96-490-7B]|uniref:radical SAM protein n=1 Tax=Austwickia sp. TVS 96-490-7B TaxID=2830843 RepID=UPI001C5706C3|nr:radical SAM protein [Austwickia sp. TVS 96-490-7B]MBW3086642.1 GTP 3',8-cyclase [Austwickia sp. TVS 96-490-7B]
MSATVSEYKTLRRRVARHLSAAQHLNPVRAANLARLISDMKGREETVKSRPIFARINPCSLCNLSCPACLIHADKEGIREYIRPKGMMAMETFRQIIDCLEKSLLQVILYDEGEPLMNKRIWDMVAYAHSRNIRTVISSNLSFKMNDETIAQMHDSGLDYLVVALDGVSQDVYGQYRQGGNVEWVMSNFERIVEYRRRYPSRTHTKVEVQFIEFDFNAHEKEAVVAYARKHGADHVNCFLSFTEELADRASLQGLPRSYYGCFDLYAIADFDIDGTLYSCDFQEDSDSAGIGNILQDDFDELWNSLQMVRLRRGFADRTGELTDRVCATCPVTRGLPRILN